MHPYRHEERVVWPALRQGLQGRCPRCGKGRLFQGFLDVVQNCEACGEAFGERYQVGLLLPFILITVIGHVLVAAMLQLSRLQVTPLMSLAIVVPLAVIVSLLLLRPAKGALVGVLWSRDLSDEQR